MQLYCRGGRVVATHDASQGVPATAYGEDVSVVPAPAGWSGSIGDDVPETDAAGLVAYAAIKRRAVISGGCVVTVAGVDVPTWTDAASQGALTGLIVAAQLNPAVQSAWKGRDGLFYTLDAADIAALATGVMAFVQAAFVAESTALAGIDAGAITTTAAIDAAPWPPND